MAGSWAGARHRKSIEQRLAELEDLHSRGVITAEELHAARAETLAEG